MIWLIVAGCVAAGAQSSGVMTLDGPGLKDVEVPEGKAEFLSTNLVDSLLHLPSEDRLPLEIAIHYRVLDPAHRAGERWVDMVIPMDYAMTTSSVQNTERRFLQLLDDSEKLVTGLSIYRGRGAQATPRSPELVREQIRLVGSLGIRGYCLFASSHLDTALVEMFGAEINDGDAVPFYR